MQEILNKLYGYEYFGIYLIVSIVVLVLLFIFILFFGKKDQKEREIEATKKLLKIEDENNTFKEDSVESKVEVEQPKEQEKLENDTIIVPSINALVEEPSKEDIPEPVLPVAEEAPSPMAFEESKEEVEPILEKVEEKPLVFEESNNTFNNIIKDEDIVNMYPEEVAEEEDIPDLVLENSYEEPVIDTLPKEEHIPSFNFDEIVNNSIDKAISEEPVKEYKAPDIFSSVYAPEKKEEDIKSDIPVPSDDELEFELPTLKKEVVEERPREESKPILNDYNLDELGGETYDIK